MLFLCCLVLISHDHFLFCVLLSQQESELILPTPVEYQKEEEEEEEVDEDVQTGGDELSDTLVDFSSTDTWKGIAPTSHIPFPPSDEVRTCTVFLSLSSPFIFQPFLYSKLFLLFCSPLE